MASSLSKALPTVGFDARPLVVSDSPHLVETQISLKSHSSRRNSLAQCMYSLAFQLAISTVLISPWRSMLKPVTGLPVLAMPSTTWLVHCGSMPMTTTGSIATSAAAVGAPCLIIVLLDRAGVDHDAHVLREEVVVDLVVLGEWCLWIRRIAEDGETDPVAAEVWETYPRVSRIRWFPIPTWVKQNPGKVPAQPWLEKRRPRER